MSTKRKGQWGPNGTGANGRKLCYCGCGLELPENANKRSTSIAGHYDEWAKVHNPAVVRRLVEQRDKGICANCGIDSDRRAREAEQTRPLIYWLARRHAFDLYESGNLPIYRGFTPSEKRYAAYLAESENGHRPHIYDDGYRWAEHWTKEEMAKRFGSTAAPDGHTWEADHIIPVVEGGGECGLENYRTLCLACHKKETAALAARRAAKRRGPTDDVRCLQLD